MTPHSESFATVKGKNELLMAQTKFSEDLRATLVLRNGCTRIRRVRCPRAGLCLATILVCAASGSAQSPENQTPLPQRSPASETYNQDRDATMQERDNSAQGRDNS